MIEACHHFHVSLCWNMQSSQLSCLTTTRFPDISGFSIWKLEIFLFFLGGEVKCGSNWSSLQTSELFHSGPCKALVGCVFQQQGYQISYRKSYLNFSTNRICSMKKLKCILSYFDLNMWEAGHHFSVSSC